MDLQSHNIECDVAIIGAGPAGSAAAKIAASAGLKVLVFEKAKTIGTSPCAGYVSLTINLDSLPERDIVQSYIRSMRTYLPGGEHYDFPIHGCVVDRTGFDKMLAKESCDCGAKYLVSSPVTGLIRGYGDLFEGIIVNSACAPGKVKSRVIIGADGVFSQTARFLGLGQQQVAHCVQYLMDGVTPLKDTAQIFFDTDYAPGGYVWIYPAGTGSVKVGLGVVKSISTVPASVYLERFISKNPYLGNRLRSGRIKEKIAGALPIGGLRNKLCVGNVLLAGDSAGMADPVTGAGINNALLSGELAGKVATKAVDKDDAAVLQSYEAKIKKLLGRTMGRSLGKREKMNSIYPSNETLKKGLPEIWVGLKV